MNNQQTGRLIRHLRLEKAMTQKKLSELLNVTEQAVSKWERGIGLPEISILPRLSECLEVNLNNMLLGNLNENDINGGRMKEAHFYVCSSCDNFIFSAGKTEVSCCGRTLHEYVPEEADEKEKMLIQEVEYDWYITSNHPMKKNDYILFSAFFVNGRIEIFSHYPEWNYELRVPRTGKGTLYWFSRKNGLQYQLLES